MQSGQARTGTRRGLHFSQEQNKQTEKIGARIHLKSCGPLVGVGIHTADGRDFGDSESARARTLPIVFEAKTCWTQGRRPASAVTPKHLKNPGVLQCITSSAFW